MFKYYFLILFFIFYRNISWGEEYVYYKISAKNIGVIYDVIELQEKNQIIIAAEKGIFSYFGKVLTKVESNTNDVIHKLYVSDGVIYALSFDEKIYKVENDSLILLYHLNVKETVNSFLVANQKIYISTPHYLIKVESNGHQTIKIFKDEYILGILKKSDSTFLFIEDKDDGKLRIQNIEDNTYSKLNFNARISKVFFSNYGNFIVVDNELYYIDLGFKKIKKLVSLPQELVKVKIFEIKSYNENVFYIGHNNGFSVFNKKEAEWKHHLNKITVHSIIQDSENSIWLGTKFEGLLQIPSLNIIQLKFSTFLNHKDRFVKSYMKNGKLFLGTNLGNVIIYDLQTQQSTSLTLENNGEVQSMFTHKNRLYVYCDLLYDIDLLSHKVLNTYPVHSTRDIYVDNNGVYCATTGDFQSVLDAKKLNNGFWHNCIYSDSLTQYLYVGNKSGLSIFKKKPFSLVNNIETTSNEKIIYISKESGKIFCYGSEGNVYSKGLKIINKYPIKSINGVLNITENEKLIYNKEAAFYIKKQSQRGIEFISNLIEDQEIISINEYNGDLIMITSPKIIIVKNYHQFLKETSENDVRLRIKTNIPMKNDSTIFLDYKNNGIQFIVSTSKDLSFFHLLNVVYKIGDNKSSTQIARNSKGELELNLEFLPEGETELTFSALDNSGKVLDQQSIIVFVKSPFWKSIWFYLISLSAFIILLFLYQKYRFTKLQARNMAEIQKEQIKTRLVRSELMAIRSQMNPHFVFNTLSTIQLKIAKKETTLASKMVQSFSSLMRGVLNHSQVEFISLKEELSILKNYIVLEQERFDEKVIVNIEVDDNIDTDYFLIPSLITQPFVENSLQHGLRHKEGVKHLEIKIYPTNETTYCVKIVDNGIGIDNANKINAEANLKKSFAINAIKKRINFMNTLEGMNINLEIKSNDYGTTVTLIINNYD